MLGSRAGPLRVFWVTVWQCGPLFLYALSFCQGHALESPDYTLISFLYKIPGLRCLDAVIKKHMETLGGGNCMAVGLSSDTWDPALPPSYSR